MRSHTKCFRRVSAFVSYVRLSYLGFCDHTDVARVAHNSQELEKRVELARLSEFECTHDVFVVFEGHRASESDDASALGTFYIKKVRV